MYCIKIYSVLQYDIYPAATIGAFGILSVVAGLLCAFLPETRGRELPKVIQKLAIFLNNF